MAETRYNLLVVDDESDNLDLLYRTFRRDFHVFKANSATQALQVLDTQGEMAVIISDQRMPQINGTEFFSQIVERFPETIRILLTGYTDVEDLVDAINSGKVFKYITKPWNPENLKAVVQQAAQTYKVLKQRTNELRRALRRESLLNAVTNAIRESLDYNSMLETIVKTIGSNFAATGCILRPVEGDILMPIHFSYRATDADAELPHNAEALMQEVHRKRLTQLAQSKDSGNLSTQLALPLIYQQQIFGVLFAYNKCRSSPWLAEDVQIIESVTEQAALAISQAKLYQRTQENAEQMRAELEVASVIQNKLLRQNWPEVEGIRVQACCYPAREVGGDFFEVYIHPQGDVWLAVGDVSGKGVPAALFMASAISLLRREVARETSPEPDAVMQNLNSILSEDLIGNNYFITMVLARYTPPSHKLVYANAGHIYPLVWSHQTAVQQRAGTGTGTIEPMFLKVRSIPVGILPVWKRAVGHLTLNAGEILLLTSDGITEATVNRQEPYIQVSNAAKSSTTTNSMLKQEGLWQLLLQQPAPFDLNNLLAQLREYTNNVQEDDQTILSLEVI